jgi:hypothetical protein
MNYEWMNFAQFPLLSYDILSLWYIMLKQLVNGVKNLKPTFFDPFDFSCKFNLLDDFSLHDLSLDMIIF